MMPIKYLFLIIFSSTVLADDITFVNIKYDCPVPEVPDTNCRYQKEVNLSFTDSDNNGWLLHFKQRDSSLGQGFITIPCTWNGSTPDYTCSIEWEVPKGNWVYHIKQYGIQITNNVCVYGG